MVRILAVSLFSAQTEHRDSIGLALSVLRLDGWTPPDAAVTILEARARWWSAPLAISEAAARADATVLFAPAPAGRASVARFAWNAADVRLTDDDGMRWPGFELTPFGPPVSHVTLAPYAMARAIELSGLDCVVDDDPPADIANRALHDLLRPGRARLAALVRLPRAIEEDRAGERDRANRMQILGGIQGALTFAAAAAEAAQQPTLPIAGKAH